MNRRSILALFFLFSAALALEPSEVLVVVNADEPESVSIGSYYMRVRDLPQNNIIALRLGKNCKTTISHEDYIRKVQKPLSEVLARADYEDIRCLLTTYKMPYRIAAPVVDDETQDIVERLQRVASDNFNILKSTVVKLNPDSGIEGVTEIPKALEAAQRIINDIISKIKATQPAQERQAKIDKFLGMSMPLYGAFIISQLSEIEFGTSYEVSQDRMIEAVACREFVDDAVRQGWSYEQCLDNGYYTSFAKVYGILKLLDLLDDSINKLRGIGMSSSFDSELALVKNANYDWYMWQENRLKSDISDPSTVIVSRIDGPTVKVCKRIIDDSILAEQTGLRGKVCVDARFSQGGGQTGYEDYDISLRQTAEMFDDAGFSVEFDETESLMFTEKPIETIFYCGWYSLQKYIDSFDFVPGAIGYHIASLEAIDIRNTQSQQWVVSMLDDGIAATIGAVDEPYLNAFPKPDEFFSYLLEGQTAAEAYAASKPYNSWQMLLIADPLYRPLADRK
ncbi:MAG: TIGR03790 family protein [Sedimentisphaeraceae bacterium JB056]